MQVMVAVWLLAGCDPATEPFIPGLVGTGTYDSDATGLRVHYHVPDAVQSLSPVVLVFHGATRDAGFYRSAWVDAANEHGFVVAVPEFTELSWPGASGYALGNVYVNGDAPSPETLRPPEEWAFSLVVPLFEELKAMVGNRSSIVHLFGHSAGAQFAHRLLMFQPEGPWGFVIAANAGWYTVPDPAVTFPYGLGSSPLQGEVPVWFDERLVVHAGSADTDPDSAALRHTVGADAQGPHRFARAGHFMAESEALAREAGAPFAWSLHVVDGVGHDFVEMSAAGGDWLAEAIGR